MKYSWQHGFSDELRIKIKQAISIINTSDDVITLVGSTKFKGAFQLTNHFLSINDKAVFTVSQFGHHTGLNMSGSDKKALDRSYLKKIDNSDAIFVINPKGYVGVGGCDEIHYALAMGKNIYWLEKPEGWDEYVTLLKTSDLDVNYFNENVLQQEYTIALLCCEIFAQLKQLHVIPLQVRDADVTCKISDSRLCCYIQDQKVNEILFDEWTVLRKACKALHLHAFSSRASIDDELIVRYTHDNKLCVSYADDSFPNTVLEIQFNKQFTVRDYLDVINARHDGHSLLYWIRVRIQEYQMCDFVSLTNNELLIDITRMLEEHRIKHELKETK